MPDSNSDEPPAPPIRADDEPVEKPEGKVRERVRRILSGVSEPAKVSSIAEMAGCSTEGARDVLREYEEMGVVIKTGENPEKYKKNPVYFQFLRGHRLAQEHTREELQERLREKYEAHREFVDRFDVPIPADVDVDERESREEYEAVIKWEGVISEADDIREAYRQQTGVYPPRIEELPEMDSITLSVDDVDLSEFVDPVSLALSTHRSAVLITQSTTDLMQQGVTGHCDLLESLESKVGDTDLFQPGLQEEGE